VKALFRENGRSRFDGREPLMPVPAVLGTAPFIVGIRPHAHGGIL
jgi:hypothetical protein